MGKRSFEQAAIVATGSQGLGDRFGKRPRASDYDDLPPIAQWRCNLVRPSRISSFACRICR